MNELNSILSDEQRKDDDLIKLAVDSGNLGLYSLFEPQLVLNEALKVKNLKIAKNYEYLSPDFNEFFIVACRVGDVSSIERYWQKFINVTECRRCHGKLLKIAAFKCYRNLVGCTWVLEKIYELREDPEASNPHSINEWSAPVNTDVGSIRTMTTEWDLIQKFITRDPSWRIVEKFGHLAPHLLKKVRNEALLRSHHRLSSFELMFKYNFTPGRTSTLLCKNYLFPLGREMALLSILKKLDGLVGKEVIEFIWPKPFSEMVVAYMIGFKKIHALNSFN
jgi:hypothetical protein